MLPNDKKPEVDQKSELQIAGKFINVLSNI